MRVFVFYCLFAMFAYADRIISFENEMPKEQTNEQVLIAQAQAQTEKPKQSLNHLKGDEFFNHYIKDRPKGIVRDFYIWQYLSENKLDSKQIAKVYNMLNAKNPYLRKILKELGRSEKVPHDVACSNMAIKTALKENNACLAISVRGRLSAFKSMGAKERDEVIARLKDSNKDTVAAIEILASHDRVKKLFSNNAIVFSMVYHALSSDEKHKILADDKALKKIDEYNTQGFFNIINSIVLDSKLQNLKQMLLKANLKQVPHNTALLLGINQLRFGSKDRAMEYFKLAESKTKNAFFIDRAVFWQYLVSKDSAYLERLLKSNNANLFTIYAVQKLQKEPSYKIIQDLPKLSFENPPFDPYDPYVWYDIADTILKGSDVSKLSKAIPYFSYKDTMPQLAYLMQKIDRFSNNYYISPYEDLIKWDSIEQKSLIFSIARQESHFIPTLISRSFALGLMQIMPANVKPFAKEMGRNDIEYNDLFNPQIALEMGRHFVRVLQREYKHPLFVAYAYNGGPGFLRRLLAKNELFLKNREYEPWISMELIPYEESRIYGMRVLANFIIYEKIFGREINLEDFMQKTLIYENKNIKK